MTSPVFRRRAVPTLPSLHRRSLNINYFTLPPRRENTREKITRPPQTMEMKQPDRDARPYSRVAP